MPRHKNSKLTIAILSCIFYTCTGADYIPNLKETKTTIEQTNKFVGYTNIELMEDYYDTLHERSIDLFALELKKHIDRPLLNQKYSKSKQIEKDRLKEYGQFIKYLDIYAEISKKEVQHAIELTKTQNGEIDYKKILSRIPDNIESYIDQIIYAIFKVKSEERVNKSDITNYNFEFCFASCTIDLVNNIDCAIAILNPIKDSIEQTDRNKIDKLPEQRRKAIALFYKKYSEEFFKKTGVEIDFEQICKKSFSKIVLSEYDLSVLIDLPIVALESYIINRSLGNKGKPVKIKELFNGNIANTLVNDEGYKLFLSAINNKIDNVLDCIQDKFTPIVNLSKENLRRTIQKSSITLEDLNSLSSYVEDLIDFKEIISPDLRIVNNNGFVIFDGQRETIIDYRTKPKNYNQANLFCKKVLGKDQNYLFSKIKKQLNRAFLMRMKNLTEPSAFDITSVPLHTIKF